MKHPTLTTRQRMIRLLFWAYMAVLLRITVFRTGFWRGPLFLNGQISLALFTEVYPPLIESGQWGRILYLFGGNIVWFLPFGAYLAWRRPGMRPVRLLLAGLGLSLLIETMQFVLGTGFSELDDLVLNTLGTGLGGWAAALWRRMARRRKNRK